MGWPEGTNPIVEIETGSPLEADATAVFVAWIPWDSGFRGSGLRVGDLIVGHEAVVYDRAAVEARIRIGDSRFDQWLRAEGRKPDDPLTLSVLRDDAPLTIRGTIGGYRTYRTAEGRPCYGADGPIGAENDGLGASWDSWHRQFVDFAKRALAGWDYYAGNYTKNLTEEIAAHAERVAFLERRYPSAYARAVAEDYAAMKAIVAGEKRDLAPADIAYRLLGDARAKDVSIAAERTFAAYLARCAGTLMVDPPSAPNSFKEHTEGLVGKLIRLPPLSKRETLFETDRSWYWSGSGEGGYLIDKASDAMKPLYAAIGEYVEKVDPNFRDAIVTFIGVVQAEPVLVSDVDRRITVSGLRLTPHVALVANASDRSRCFFVDLQRAEGAETFAGEAALEAGIRRPALKDGDTPQRVLEVAFEALKVGDMKTWLSCYASWHIRRFYEKDASFAWVDRTWEVMSEVSGASVWDRARRRLLDDVYGAEVAKVSAPYVVFDIAEAPAGRAQTASGPRIAEEVKAVVNHIGRFGEEYRTFSGFMLHRRWVLQRLDDGPWRIAIDQAL